MVFYCSQQRHHSITCKQGIHFDFNMRQFNGHSSVPATKCHYGSSLQSFSFTAVSLFSINNVTCKLEIYISDRKARGMLPKFYTSVFFPSFWSPELPGLNSDQLTLQWMLLGHCYQVQHVQQWLQKAPAVLVSSWWKHGRGGLGKYWSGLWKEGKGRERGGSWQHQFGQILSHLHQATSPVWLAQV